MRRPLRFAIAALLANANGISRTTFAGARRTSATISRDARIRFREQMSRNKSNAPAVYDADSTRGITHTSEDPTTMFTTFRDRTNSSVSSIIKAPLFAILAAIAIAGIVFITLGRTHPSDAETAVARAIIDAKQPSHAGN
jgi:hypothetical protein